MMNVGKYAVMRQSHASRNMKFRVLRDSYGSAVAEAQRMYTQCVAETGNPEIRFFVVRLVDVVGVVDGRLEPGGKER